MDHDLRYIYSDHSKVRGFECITPTVIYFTRFKIPQLILRLYHYSHLLYYFSLTLLIYFLAF